MIKLDDRYAITADNYNFILTYTVKPEDADEALLARMGKERATEDRIKPLSYHNDLSGALTAYVKAKLRRSIAENHTESFQDLKALIRELTAVVDRFSAEGAV